MAAARAVIAALAALLLSVTGTAVAATAAHLDAAFGHHGRIVRHGPPWILGSPIRTRPGGGTVLLSNGRAVGVDRRWRLDLRYGTNGMVRTGLPVQSVSMPFRDGVLLTSAELGDDTARAILTLDDEGRPTPFGAAASAAIAGSPPDAVHDLGVYRSRIVDVTWRSGTHHTVDWTFAVLGTPAVPPIPLVWPKPFRSSQPGGAPVGTRDGVVVAAPRGLGAGLMRIGWDGVVDRRWGDGGIVRLKHDVTQILPGRAGGVVAVGDDALQWVDARGRVVRSRGVSVQHDTWWNAETTDRAGRLLLARWRGFGADGGTTRRLAVRRYLTDGRVDRGFARSGLLKLPVPDHVYSTTIVPRDDGTLDVVAGAARVVPNTDPFSREDFEAEPTGVVIWRVRTR